MTTRSTSPKVTAAERNAAVLAVLLSRSEPIGPTDIARAIGEPWCVWDFYPASSAITPVLRRIGAVRHKGGLYTKPETQA